MDIKCPVCDDFVELHASPCLDFECCGIPHMIGHLDDSECKWGFESFDRDAVKNEWLKLGGSEDTFNKEFGNYNNGI